LPLALAASAAAALLVGALVVRTSGVYFIMVTLAFAQMGTTFFNDTRIAGGSDGIYVNTRPDALVRGWIWPRSHFYYFVLAALAIVFALLAIILRSPFGRALQGIKANEHRMRALGFATLRYKLAAFVLAGTIAGTRRLSRRAKEGYVNPEMMAWHQSGTVLMMLILGGMGTLFGAVLGAFSYVRCCRVVLRADQALATVDGALHRCAVLLLPQGLIGLHQLRIKSRVPRAGRDSG
jgi:branched-chain amino acid transport system permease protein